MPDYAQLLHVLVCMRLWILSTANGRCFTINLCFHIALNSSPWTAFIGISLHAKLARNILLRQCLAKQLPVVPSTFLTLETSTYVVGSSSVTTTVVFFCDVLGLSITACHIRPVGEFIRCFWCASNVSTPHASTSAASLANTSAVFGSSCMFLILVNVTPDAPVFAHISSLLGPSHIISASGTPSTSHPDTSTTY